LVGGGRPEALGSTSVCTESGFNDSTQEEIEPGEPGEFIIDNLKESFFHVKDEEQAPRKIGESLDNSVPKGQRRTQMGEKTAEGGMRERWWTRPFKAF